MSTEAFLSRFWRFFDRFDFSTEINRFSTILKIEVKISYFHEISGFIDMNKFSL